MFLFILYYLFIIFFFYYPPFEMDVYYILRSVYIVRLSWYLLLFNSFIFSARVELISFIIKHNEITFYGSMS